MTGEVEDAKWHGMRGVVVNLVADIHLRLHFEDQLRLDARQQGLCTSAGPDELDLKRALSIGQHDRGLVKRQAAVNGTRREKFPYHIVAAKPRIESGDLPDVQESLDLTH